MSILKQESGYIFNDFVIIIASYCIDSVAMYGRFMICNKTDKHSSKRWKKTSK